MSAFKNWIQPSLALTYLQPFGVDSSFANLAKKELSKRELKPRVRWIAEQIHQKSTLPYAQTLKRLLDLARSQNLNGFSLWPLTEYIQLYGLECEKESLEALKILTEKFTGEFAIRPFLKKNPKYAYAYLEKMAKSSNEHHRRWASEGSRPRLPWGERLDSAIENPEAGIKILELLKFDDSLYVRKSVANHLNDIAKDHPLKVVEVLKKWSRECPTSYQKEFQFILHRALRTLIKKSHREAMALVKVDHHDPKKIRIYNFNVNTSQINLGDKLIWQVELQNLSHDPQNFILDYEIHFIKANGKRSPKIFKGKKGQLKARENLRIQKSHHLKKITTMKFYNGKHSLRLLLNGKHFFEKEFLFRAT